MTTRSAAAVVVLSFLLRVLSALLAVAAGIALVETKDLGIGGGVFVLSMSGYFAADTLYEGFKHFRAAILDEELP